MDFITVFGASFEAAPLSLLEVQQMVAYPLETPHLSQFYVALLRCLLLEAVSAACWISIGICLPRQLFPASLIQPLGPQRTSSFAAEISALKEH